MNAMRALQAASYVNLRTFRKSGAAVDTPVWCAPGDDEELYIFSAGNAGKIKRLRSSDRAELAVCDVRGKLLGEWVHARAEIITDDAAVDRALAALRSKYGWQMKLADIGAKLTGKFGKRAYIRASLV
jgi:PPOX class probable F420-dependent enzyme